MQRDRVIRTLEDSERGIKHREGDTGGMVGEETEKHESKDSRTRATGREMQWSRVSKRYQGSETGKHRIRAVTRDREPGTGTSGASGKQGRVGVEMMAQQGEWYVRGSVWPTKSP